MGVRRIFSGVFFGLIFLASISFAQKTSEDDGTMDSFYMPQEITAIFKLEKDQKPNLIAKYEPKKGARYYIYYLDVGNLIQTVFFKIEDGVAYELGRDEEEFPFVRFVKDPQAVDALWRDLLSRWIKRDGRKNLQDRLNLRAHEAISEEEISQYKKAGFKVPETAQHVKDYE